MFLKTIVWWYFRQCTAARQVLNFAVFLLYREIQRGRVKCGRYWPTLGNFEQYGDIEISCLEETEKENDFIIRKFILNDSKVWPPPPFTSDLGLLRTIDIQ